VNLAEILHHGSNYAEATGIDLVSFISAAGIRFHSPDAAIARRVADLAVLNDISLADRFAAATAQELGARLYTTESVLAGYRARLNVPVTRF
jgi:predicted nucleic acid-binding protein